MHNYKNYHRCLEQDFTQTRIGMLAWLGKVAGLVPASPPGTVASLQ